MRGLLLGVAAVLSGAAALVHQTVWTRAFAVILGSTAEAASATFAGFLVGLAAGAVAYRKRADRAPRVLRSYAWVEVGIAVAAPLTGLALHFGREPLAALIGPAAQGRVLVAIAVVTLTVLPATALMGATFPLLLACGRRLAGSGTALIPRLYALNTLGAACGALAAGFVLLGALGVYGTIATAAVCNLLAAAALVPLLLADERKPPRDDVDEAPSPDEREPSPPPRGARLEPALLVVALLSGALTLGTELIWMRLASYFVGNRTYAFSLQLACVLLLLSLGAWLAGLVHRRARGAPLLPLALLLLLGAASIAGLVRVGGIWIRHQTNLEQGLPGVETLLLVYRALEALLLMAPTFVLLGALFPLCLTSTRVAGEETGRAAGAFYFVNTVGSVLGSLGVGFFGFAALGTHLCAIVLSLLGCVAAAGLAVRALKERPGLLAKAVALLALGLCGVVPYLLPGELGYRHEGDVPLLRREDQYGVFQIARVWDGTLRVTNDRTELVFRFSAPPTAYVQQMQGHLGMFYRPDAKRAVVLGSGYGITAGALSQYDQLERVDAVEILPAMVDAAELFATGNFRYHAQPNVHVVVDDGRHFLARSTERYDVVSINVSDPHLPGGASLFHLDFYEEVKEHLSARGVVVQHAFGADVDIVLSTLRAAFPHVRLFGAYGNGFNVVAATWDLDDADPAAADRLFEQPRVRDALTGIGFAPPFTPGAVVRAAMTEDDVPHLIKPGVPIATDAHPRIELSFRGNARALLFSNE